MNKLEANQPRFSHKLEAVSTRNLLVEVTRRLEKFNSHTHGAQTVGAVRAASHYADTALMWLDRAEVLCAMKEVRDEADEQNFRASAREADKHNKKQK